MEPESLISLLVSKMRTSGDAVEYDQSQGAVVVSTWGGRSLDRRIVVLVAEEDLREAINIDAAELAHLWPGVDVRVAGINLLLVHLREYVETEKVGGGRLRIGPKGLELLPEGGAARRETLIDEAGGLHFFNPHSGDEYPEM
jgi:hypothetical protein